MQRKTITASAIRRQNLASLNVNYEMQDGRRPTSGLKSLLEIERQDREFSVQGPGRQTCCSTGSDACDSRMSRRTDRSIGWSGTFRQVPDLIVDAHPSVRLKPRVK
jgi:hypothetical protein